MVVVGLVPTVFLLVAGLSGFQALPDPCLSNYTEIYDNRRSTSYHMLQHEVGLCDAHFVPGWYRFTVGGVIPEHCQHRFQCGTLSPVWMNGTHPSVSDGIVSRQACADTGLGSCCDSSLQIGVKNCVSFFIYYLYPTPACPMAYCFGDRTPCPSGKGSVTGFPPCVDVYPTNLAEPSLSPPLIQNHAFRFVCTVPHPQHDPDLRMEVQWTFDGVSDPNIPNIVLADPKREAILPGSLLHGHMGHTIGCRVRAWYENRSVLQKSQWRDNNETYYAGIRVEPGKVEVSEKGGNSSIRVTSTMPVICDHNYTDSCCIHFLVDVDGPKNNVAVPHPCRYKLCTSDWDPTSHTASVNITLAATKDGIRDGDKLMLLTVEKLQAVGGGPYLDIFSNYSLPSTQSHKDNVRCAAVEEQPEAKEVQLSQPSSTSLLMISSGLRVQLHLLPLDLAWNPVMTHTVQVCCPQITVKDADTKKCSWNGDPHITGFSGNHLNLLAPGDFTMYENKKDNFQLQSRNVVCGRGSASCQCGLAIREQSDVIHINSCLALGHAPVVETNHQPLRQGTVIQRSNDGKHIVVYLPSGREVRVDALYHHNVVLSVPGSDDGEGRGICGTLDGSSSGDKAYTHRNGIVQNDACPSSKCVPKEFTESWRENHATSLFEHVPANINNVKGDDANYCQCDTGVTGPARINCTAKANGLVHTLHCGARPCSVVPPSALSFLQPQVWTSTIGRRGVGSLYTDQDEPDPPFNFTSAGPLSSHNPSWPTQSGITESHARRRCRSEIHGAQLFAYCRHMTSLIEDAKEDCVADILYSDSYDMVESSVTAFTAGCQFEMVQNISNYDTDKDGNLVLKAHFADVCSVSCLRHGRCVSGKCVCHTGYTGDNCQLVAGVPPRLDRIRGPSACDVNIRPCRKIFFDADHFQMGDHFKCKVQEVLPGGNLSSVFVEEAAQFIRGNLLACPLPDARLKTDRSVKTFAVSVTFDGHHYSNVLHVTTYDSTCQSCEGQKCTQKVNTCLIDDLCHQDGDVNADDATKMCRTSLSISQWSATPDTSSSNYPALEVPTLTGPNEDYFFTCTLHSPSHEPSARFQVTWLVGGAEIQRETLAEDQREAGISFADLPSGSISLQCQVRSFYDGHSHFSQYMQSTPLSINKI